ncbi:MAG: AIR synthase-related protein, partial [Oscillospiraceae bacterium]
MPGDLVILLGGRTGRDGCGGATGSSSPRPPQPGDLRRRGAKGNAPVERKLQRLFRNGEATRLIRRCNDFGAGGVSVAIGELADGLDIDLDRVPRKYEGLDGTELAISESQERMAVVVSAADAERFLALAAAENLEATVVASVTAEPRLRMRWRGKTIADLSREFLASNGAEKHARVSVPVTSVEDRSPAASGTLEE